MYFFTHITSDLDKVTDVLILIDKGRIVLSEEKDILLNTHGLVKGDKIMLNDNTRNLFLTLHENGYSFEGITNNKIAVRQQMNGLLTERPTIESVMLAYVGCNKNVV